ncbi:MAG TPA: VOC family protein [Acetobacteraceae bacterium]|nr:VOC family protein [Acetobacteraceae bacterium]
MLHHVGGIDHCVVLVRNLDAAADSYARLGFTVAPRGIHSPQMGTGNHCIMLRGDYFEMLGVLTPTPANQRWRDVLAHREGMSAVALRAHDAEAGAAEIAAQGVPTLPVMHFGRPVRMPDGSTTETRFHTFHLRDMPIPGLRLFACQHLTPDATWVPGLMDHANGAEGLAAVEVLAEDSHSAAAVLATLFGRGTETEADGALRVPTGAAPLVLLTAAQLAARYPEMDLSGLAADGPVTMAIRVADLAQTERVLRSSGVRTLRAASGLAVAPADAHGVILVFRPG